MVMGAVSEKFLEPWPALADGRNDALSTGAITDVAVVRLIIGSLPLLPRRYAVYDKDLFTGIKAACHGRKPLGSMRQPSSVQANRAGPREHHVSR